MSRRAAGLVPLRMQYCPTQASLCCTCSAFPCRATTVYLVQRRIDMLPKPLTEDICSLR